MSLRDFILGVISAILALGLLIARLLFLVMPEIFQLSCILPATFHVRQMERVISNGEMGWDGDVQRIFDHLVACKRDKRALAQTLLSNHDGTIVSLGMDLVVRESFEDGNYLLARLLDDTRWNFNLTHNDEYARFLIAAWKTKRQLALTEEDKETMRGWSKEYFERLNVKPSEMM